MHVGFRLLGDLPTLGPRSHREDVKIALSLELPGDSTKKSAAAAGGKMLSAAVGKDTASKATLANEAATIPSEFLCAINGHVMKVSSSCEC